MNFIRFKKQRFVRENIPVGGDRPLHVNVHLPHGGPKGMANQTCFTACQYCFFATCVPEIDSSRTVSSFLEHGKCRVRSQNILFGIQSVECQFIYSAINQGYSPRHQKRCTMRLFASITTTFFPDKPGEKSLSQV